MTQILNDNERLLIAALRTIHGSMTPAVRLKAMAGELIAHRHKELDPEAFDLRMSRYLTRLETSSPGAMDPDAHHTLMTIAIANMIPALTDPKSQHTSI